MEAIIYTCCRGLLHPHTIKRLHFTNEYDMDLRGSIKQRIVMCAVVGGTTSCRNIKATSKHIGHKQVFQTHWDLQQRLRDTNNRSIGA